MNHYSGKSDLAAKTCLERLTSLCGITEEFSIITDGLNYFQGFKLRRELYDYTTEYCDFLDQLMSDTASWYEIIIEGEHTGYYSHCLGYVARKTHKGLRIIKPYLSPSKKDKGYPKVDLCPNYPAIEAHLAIAKHTPEHRAFLEFLCEKEKEVNPAYKMAMENPEDKKILFNHVNENKFDSRLCNMQICNATWNSFYSRVLESGHESLFEMILELRRQWAEIVGDGGITRSQKNAFIARVVESYGVDAKFIRRIINGDSYKWIK